MKILVTGANGQLGHELRTLLSQRADAQVLYTDIDTLDLSDREAVRTAFEAFGPDIVVNCAAYTAVDRAENDSQAAFIANAQVPENIGIVASECGSRVIHISTDYVFDGTAHLPYTEDSDVNPLSQYGVTKLQGEQKLVEALPHAVVIRTAWLYSPYGNNFLKTMLRLGQQKEEIGVVVDQIGTPTYAADLASAILAVIDAPAWHPGIYHFTNQGVASWYDFAVAIMHACGLSCKVRPITTDQYPTAAHRPSYSVLSKTKISETYDLDIPHWHDAMMRCLANIPLVY